MRVALCIAGQVRHDELYFDDLAKLAQAMGAQVFFSVWRRRGVKKTGTINSNQRVLLFGRVFGPLLPARFRGRQRFEHGFPDFAAEVDLRLERGLPPVTAEALLARFPGAMVDIEDEETLCLAPAIDTQDNNSLRMLYRIWRCNEMKRRFEAASGQPFGVVIRCRPDVLPATPPDTLAAAVAEPDSRLMLVNGLRQDFVDDRAAMSGTRAADHYAALFGKLVQAPARPWRGIHGELWTHLSEAGLDLRPLALERGMAAVPAHQAACREALLDLIAEGRRADGIYDEAGWGLLHRVLLAAHRLEGGDLDGATALWDWAADDPQRLAGMSGPLVAMFFAAIADILGRRGEAANAYVALLISWAILPPPDDLAEPELALLARKAIALATRSEGPGEPAAQLSWETAARHLAEPGLPALLARPARRALAGRPTDGARTTLERLRPYGR
jgi:hypothetical protein